MTTLANYTATLMFVITAALIAHGVTEGFNAHLCIAIPIMIVLTWRSVRTTDHRREIDRQREELYRRVMAKYEKEK